MPPPPIAGEPLTATVECRSCGRDFEIVLDVLRHLIENGGSPHCGCKVARPGPTTVKNASSPRSKSDLLLLTIASHQTQDGTDDVPTQRIVVTAWSAHPASFGLADFTEKYPSDNRVIMELVKMKGRGLLSQPREKHYAITAAGRKIVAQLRAKK